MVALKHYAEHVKEAVAARCRCDHQWRGASDELPELVSETCRTKIAPIVSSKRAAQLILKMWAHKYDRTADFLVVEGPKAGGHLGFSREQLDEIDTMDYDEEIRQIIACKEEYEKRYEKKIPVIVAGGIFDKMDIEHAFELGADGVQIASSSWQQKNVMRQSPISWPISMQKKRMSRLSKVRLECRGVLFATH